MGWMRRGRAGGVALALLVVLGLLAGACSSSGSDGGSSSASAAGAASDGARHPWPTHGFDLANTRATDDPTITAANVGRLGVAWQTPNLKGVSANPVVDGGVVYVTDWTGHVRALDAATGHERWAVDLHTYYVSGSVAVDATHVFVGDFGGKLHALDRATGEPRWVTDVSVGGGVLFGAPLVVHGLVVVELASFQEFTDSPRYTFRGHVDALDAATGALRWRFWTTAGDATSGPGVAMWASPVADAARHLVYVGTGNNYDPPSSPLSDAVVAIDDRTGTEAWHTRFTTGDVWTSARGDGPDDDVGAAPNLYDLGGHPLLAVGDKAGVMRGLDRATGKVLWTTDLTKGGPLGGVLASGAYHGGVEYVASNRGGTAAELFALDAATGAIRWHVDVGGHMAGPVSWAGGLVLTTDDRGKASAFDDRTGRLVWSAAVAGPAAGAAIVAGGTLYLGYGWWLTTPPKDAQGGLVAYRVADDDGSSDTASSGAASASGPAATTTPISGQTIFERSCASCHGTDGTGGFGPSLVGVSKRLTLDLHLAIVRTGRRRMPKWQGVLSEAEIEAVVAYERATFR